MTNETFDSYQPTANALLQPDGSTTTFDGTIITASSEAGVEDYERRAPIVNKFINPDGSIKTLDEITGGEGGVEVVQEQGQSTTNVMSQKAVTDSLKDPALSSTMNVRIASMHSVTSGTQKRGVLIGTNGSGGTGDGSVFIGSTVAGATPSQATALGFYSKTSASYSVALGAQSTATVASVVSVGDGSSDANYGTRRIINVKDPQNTQDAATKVYVDVRVPTPPTTGTYTLQSVNGVTSWIQS